MLHEKNLASASANRISYLPFDVLKIFVVELESNNFATYWTKYVECQMFF